MGDREWLWMRWLLVLDVTHNPFAHFFRAVNVATLNLNLWGADVLLKTLVNGLTDQRAFFLQVEISAPVGWRCSGLWLVARSRG